MALAFMEHFLIQSADIEATKNWWVNVLGMRVGPSPDFKFPVYWLYVGDRDVLHLTQGGANVSANRMKYLGQSSQDTQGSGVVDHIGFRAHGLEETIAHLNTLGIKFTERQVDDQGLYQLFLFDPNGIKVELNFAASESKDRKAPVMASEMSDATPN
jgi:catechol 2,3-dioxygenase-like lactoylglutathione lyase family enzyme